MDEKQVKDELSKAKKIDKRYMMATKAYHMLGDISSDSEDYCVIYSETDDFYVGNWMEGLGFVNVLFPKSTTLNLTEDQQEYIDNSQLVIL